MKITRRDFLKVTGLTAAAMGLAACGSSSSSTAASTAGSTAASGAATAVTLPKNIEVQLPASAGGGTDVVGRALTSYINANSNSNLTVVNNTDGSGVVACETVRTAKTDGSKILFFHTTMCIKHATGVYDKSPSADFKTIAITRGDEPGGYVLVVNNDLGVTNVEEFIAKANETELMIGIETGGSSHLMAGMLSGELGIPLKYVEAGADTEKLTALVGGSIHCALVNGNQAKQYVEAGKLTAIACFSTSDEGGRCTNLPDVPSFVESGYNLVYGTRFFILGPKEMDDATAKAIWELFDAALADEETLGVLTGMGMGQIMEAYEDGPALLKAQEESLVTVVNELGLNG